MAIMPTPSHPTVSLLLVNGDRVHVASAIADRVRGIDVDGDLLLCDETLQSPDGTEYLVPLTPCCRATGKGVIDSETGIACRRCYRDVHYKYGDRGELAIGLAATVTTVTSDGRTGRVLTLTATATDGPTSLLLVGARGDGDRELRERLKAAMYNSGRLGAHRSATVRVDPLLNLSTVTAAAVATAAIAATAGISTRRLATTAVLGDVSLDGSLRPTTDVATAIQVAHAHGIRRAIVPAACLDEASFVDDVEVHGVHQLSEITDWMRSGGTFPAADPAST